MKASISLAVSISDMPQIMFAGNLEKHASMLAHMGYDGLDLFIPDPQTADIAAIEKVLCDTGLGVAMLAAHGDIMADGLFLNDATPANVEKLLERSRRHLEWSARLAARPNIGFIRGRLPQGDHETRRKSLLRMADGVRRYCELAAGMGVAVLLEPICRYEINSANTVHQALDLYELAERPANLSLLLDLFHMNIEDSSLCGSVAKAGALTGHVHFVENTRGVPGSGCLPLGDVVAVLQAAGYTGYLGVEAIPGPDPEAEALRGLHMVRHLVAARKVSS
jgi:sugar phosphate isomerase/epimerase